MEVDGPGKTLEAIGNQATAAASSAPTPKDASPLPDPNALPEHETFLSLLTILLLLDHATSASNDVGLLAKAFDLSTRLTTDYLAHQNRRSLDSLAAKVWFYHSRLAELLETTSADRHAGAWDAIRPSLLAAHRTATLRRDEDTQATALNLLVRNYLGHDLWDQADRLVGKSEFPEFGMGSSVGVVGHVPPGQVARWLYYIGSLPVCLVKTSNR